MSSKFMQQVRNVLRVKRYSYKTEQSYCYWIKYFIRYHNLKHPQQLGPDDVKTFLTYLAVQRNVAAATQNQALNALNFLYTQIIGRPLGDVTKLVRAKKAAKIPVVFERDEINAIFSVINPLYKLPVQLMYGSGLRLMECLRLRIKDINFHRKFIIIRDGKGSKDRVTLLPESLTDSIQSRIKEVRHIHAADVEAGFGKVWMPDALSRKYPSEAYSIHWQYLFCSYKRSIDPRDKEERRHHFDDSTLQRAVKQAIHQAGIEKKRQLPLLSPLFRYTLTG